MVSYKYHMDEIAPSFAEIAAEQQAGLRHTARELARIWNYPVPAWALEPTEVNQ